MVAPVVAAAPAAAPAASSIAGPLIAGGGALAQGMLSSAFNWASANKQMKFQERMSSTAHQREMADLRKAGLNPILSARHGGASSPPGAGAQASGPDAMHTALQAQLAQAQIRDVNSAAALKDTQAADIDRTQFLRLGQMHAEIDRAIASGELSHQEMINAREQKKVIEKQLEILQVELSTSALGLDHARRESEFYKGIGGKIAPWMKLNPMGNTGINLLRLKTPTSNRRTDVYHHNR